MKINKKVLNCIICNIEIKQIMEGKNSEEYWNGAFSGGIVDRLSAGYGSKLDGDMYVIAICDKCITEKHKIGVIEYLGDYLFPEQSKNKG